MDVKIMFLLFMLYSFIGWLMEVTLVSVKAKKLTARGFLIGPYCPIYGTGALLITLFLSKYENDIMVLFFMSCIFGAFLEYFTSYIMEKIFHTRWWDYSDHKYNINGRISLTTTAGFGALGVILIKILDPFFLNLIEKINPKVQLVLAIVIGIIFITDVIVSFKIISNIKDVKVEGKDTTGEMNKKVKETLKNKSIFTRRLVNSFPNLRVKFKEDIKKIKENIQK